MYYTVGCEQIFVDKIPFTFLTTVNHMSFFLKLESTKLSLLGRFPLHTSQKPMAFAPVKSSHLMAE